MTREKEVGDVPPKQSVKPINNTEMPDDLQKGYVPSKPPVKPPTNKK